MIDQINCEHKWNHNKGDSNIKCVFCIYYQDPAKRATCRLCLKQACMSCLKQQNDMKNESVAKIIYEENKVQLEEEVILEEKENKYLNNTPQEFFIPRLSFKTQQILSYFTRDIIDLIWKKYVGRHYKTFHDIQNYFMKLYQGKERHLGIIVNANIFSLLHLDKLIVKPHQRFLILRADINLKYFRSI